MRKLVIRSIGAICLMLTLGCSQRVTPIGPGYIFEPNKDERRLWQTSELQAAALAESGARYRDPELGEYIRSVLLRVIGNNPLGYAPLSLDVYVLDSSAVNAFALPDGSIFLHTAILGRIRNESQLAMLLGHEITHATHRHTHLECEHTYAQSGAAGYLAVLSSLGGANIQNIVGGLSGLIAQASVSGYSRDKEEEADKVGLTLIAQAGYDPRAGAEMFQRMLDATEKKDRGWHFLYATHPKMKDRVTSCRKLIERMPPEVLASAKEAGQDRYVAMARDLIYQEAETHVVQGKYDLAEETLKFMGEARPDDAEAFARLGDLHRVRLEPGDKARARAAYADALERDPENLTAHRGLGLLCMKAGEREKALNHLQFYADNAVNAPDVAYIHQYIEQQLNEN